MSAYGAGAPSYDDAELQKEQITGRLKVARAITDRAIKAGNRCRAAKWQATVDDLLDRLLELRGR